MEDKRNLESFKQDLKGYSDWRASFRVVLDGLTNNVFAISLREINKANPPTLKLRNPDEYGTIKNWTIREALIVSSRFQATHIEKSISRRGVEV